jgi:UDP-galactopyranose mutase
MSDADKFKGAFPASDGVLNSIRSNPSRPNGYKNLIVGAGISGAVLARMLAIAGERVAVIDAREYIAGNCYDYKDDGIMVHRHGPHIFHTNDKAVWDFCSAFTDWVPFQLKVLGLVDGQFVPIPFNLNSLRALFPTPLADKLESRLVDYFGMNKKVPILELRKTGHKDLEFLADYIYQKVFLEYTLKQWGQTPDQIDPGVTGRVPVYVSRDDRYFPTDKYQGIPRAGYTEMIKNMLDHRNIEVRLKKPFSKNMEYGRLFYTGPIDEFFDYSLGELPYRSLRIDFQKHNKPRFQGAAVVNYPCNYDWTRICEHKWFLDDQSPETIVSYEYPAEFKNGDNERYYPIANRENNALYDMYQEKANNELRNVFFLGRLGDYKYYNMDQAVARALALAQAIIDEETPV